MRLALSLLALLTSALPAAARPVIFWASDPVAPGEAVVVLGEGLGPDTTVEFGRLADAASEGPTAAAIAPDRWVTEPGVQASRQSVKAVVPAELTAGVFALRVRRGAELSEPVLLNAPDPWWHQGDEGETATPGGWLRLFGKGLGGGRVLLRGADDRPCALAAKRADAWSLAVDLPATLAPGRYQVWAHNGHGGAAGWRTAPPLTVAAKDPWPQAVFRLGDFAGDSDTALHAALAKAGESGGGVVLLPAGSYDLKEPLVIPPRTVLRGVGADRVSLHIANRPDPPEAWISGSRYGLEGLSIYCFNYQRVIADTMDSDRLRLHQVRVRAVPDAVRSQLKEPTKKPFALLHIVGRNAQVTDCDLYAAVAGMGPGRVIVTGPFTYTGTRGPWYARIADCRLWGHLYGAENLKGMIFEHNQVTGVAVGPSTYWNNFSGWLYFADNTVEHVYGGDRELLTGDAGGGAYFGKLARAEGTMIELASDPVFHDYAPRPHTDYAGGAVMILDGTGAGQYRFVVRNEGRRFELDQPWDVVPDATSRVSIAPFRGRTLIVGNTFRDGGAVQLYGAALDVIVAGNQGARMDGFCTWGLNPHGWGWHPTWRCQFLDNHVTEPSGYGARVWGPVWIGVISSNSNAEYDGPLARGTIFRRNQIDAQGMLRADGNVVDTLFERCAVRDSAVGLRVGKAVRGTWLRENRFDGTAKPTEVAAEAQASTK